MEKEGNLESLVLGKLKTVVMDGSKIEEMVESQNKKRLCKSIIKGLARHNRKERVMLSELEEENQDVVCIDDVTGEEFPWHAVRMAREQELKYLRDVGVFEKVDEHEAIAKYQVTPVDTKWIETDESV